MRPLLYALPGSEGLGARLAEELDAEPGALEIRRFPDGESYVRLLDPPDGRDVVVVCSLDRPNPKVIPLLLVLETCRALKCRSVGLVAPYLCYMRQDRRFHEGEAVSARVFPRIVERSMDWLVTVDPHLHRIHDLEQVYNIPSAVVAAAPAIARWIAAEVDDPLLIGPDEESGQWVREVAGLAGAPALVLTKVRHGDRDVELTVPGLDRWTGRTPILVDDIVSTGRTMATAVEQLVEMGTPAPVCIGVHALFADGAPEALRDAGAGRVVTADSVEHPTNRIGLAPLLAEAVRRFIATG